MKKVVLSAAAAAAAAALLATPAQAFWGSWNDGPWYGGPWHGGPWYGGYPGYGYGYPGYGYGGYPGYGYGGYPYGRATAIRTAAAGAIHGPTAAIPMRLRRPHLRRRSPVRNAKARTRGGPFARCDRYKGRLAGPFYRA